MNVGIKTVAAAAGVSVGTVSNVVNRPHLVAPATLARVQAVITDLGFVRNESARQLRAGRSRTIALVVLDVANPFFTDVGHGVEAVAEAGDVMVVLCNSAEDPARERRHLDMLQQQRVLGVLISPVDTAGSHLHELARAGIPVVLVDRAAGSQLCSVAVDDVQGGSMAMQHLLDQGHRRVAFAGGPLSIDQVADRLRGAGQAVEQTSDRAGLVVFGTAGLSIAAGRAVGQDIAALRAAVRPTGVVCGNDLLAIGMLQGLQAAGLRVPQDVAIVGYDDIDFAASASVPLSSVRQPRRELGETAARLLLDEVRQGAEHRHEQITFEPELVIRTSSTWRRRRRPARADATSSPVPGAQPR